jgi:signal transduction histidine kinase
VTRRWEAALIALGSLALTASPLAVDGWPRTVEGNIGALSLVAGGLCLVWWRSRVAVVLGLLLLLVPTVTGPEPPDLILPVLFAYAILLGERFSGRSAWLAGAGWFGYILTLYWLSGDNSPGLWVFSVPGFVAGTALRLRRETAEELVIRAQELEDERELFTELAVRNERARIAAELHDIVGHAISVMVVQAAAGQRLVDRDPAAAEGALAVIAESARQGRADLRRLVDLLGGSEVEEPDLSLVDEVVRRAASSGLQVTCRFEGDRAAIRAPVSHAAYRVVQEGLTNALRHAPGTSVRVLVSADGQALTIRVENDPLRERPVALVTGTGRGLLGLRERVQQLGGTLRSGATPSGGWAVEAALPM